MLSIIVPVYNEGEGIKLLLDEIEAKVSPPFEVVIVYDFDEDNTVAMVKKLWNDSPGQFKQVRLIKNFVARGPSGAIRSGFQSAQGKAVLVTMGDLSDDISQVDGMRERLKNGVDIVCPSRYCEGGRQDLFTIKAWIPRWVAKMLNLLTGIPTLDTTNSFRLYSKEVIDSFSFRSTHSFSISLEVLCKAFLVNYKIVEIPTVWNTRKYGKSRFPFLGSLFSYLPWFFMTLLKNRVLPLPLFLRKSLVGFKGQNEAGGQ